MTKRFAITSDIPLFPDHVLFSEERMAEQIDIVLSEAIEKVFEGGAVQNIVQLEGAP